MVKSVVVCGAVFSANAPVVLLFLALNLFIIAITTFIGSAESYLMCSSYDDDGNRKFFTLCESIRIYVLMIGIAGLVIASLLTLTALIMFCLRRERPTYIPASAPLTYEAYAGPVHQQPSPVPPFSVSPPQQPTQGYANPLSRPVGSAFSVGPAQHQQHYRQICLNHQSAADEA